ncbi:MAG TPA: 1-deoxy-D-xylulose-5-phosphate reductoisomerase [Dissulfurispiraceae bacterium]|nr:1-deoxy-D-xylulose-5-phosphate reductoisomerase [Dissulfurispiraceae bacterium]
MKNIVILGSTGSIGRSALDIVHSFRRQYRVVGLAAGKNIDLLVQQIEQYRPQVVAVSDEAGYKRLKALLGRKRRPEVLCGESGVCAVAGVPDADIILSAIVGSAGLLPTLAAVRAGKTVALANKEALVTAGGIVMAEARRRKVAVLPVDSEHSALFQCMHGWKRHGIRRLILTASGGPFRGWTAARLRTVRPEDALRHPNWSMGKKITIDSATLMNKGLEVIEAHHLFGMPVEQVGVLIHAQSIVHSIVEYVDGSYLAQMSKPDMRGPIALALAYPERLSGAVEPLRLSQLSSLTFEEPDMKTFPCLGFAYEAITAGGTLPAVMNAANEIAVNAFLEKRIRFVDIPRVIETVMGAHTIAPAGKIDAVIEADRWARRRAQEEIPA